ncbi:MAG: glycosyltransferase family 4 protein [Acidobacteriota bacterium]|nr:glycosyltransferase family 4 protein [Acidobacteriota bacterium]
MRVLHVISSGGMYGAEAVILNLSHALAEQRHSSMLGVFSNSAQPNLQLHQRALQEGIESHLISCAGQIDLSVPEVIRQLANKTQADVVHAHGYKADVYVYLAMKKWPIPIVSTCHGWIEPNAIVRLYGALDRFLLRSYAGIVAVSEEVRQKLLRAGVNQDRVRLIQNGIDLKPYAAARRGIQNASEGDRPLQVGFVGRLSQEKGPDLFLRAAAEVLKEIPGTRFVVAGDGPEKAALESLMESLKIREQVSLLGRTEDMPSFYASLDILVSSSRQEGLPIALLEGMASGLPLVATAVGSVPEIVQRDRTGILVPAENVQALASGIKELLQRPTLRQHCGSAAKALIAESYSADRMAADYISLYENVIAQKKHR